MDRVVEKWNPDRLGKQYLRDAINSISGYFFDWVNTVDICGEKKEPYSSIIDVKNDIVLSFNYTETIESIYGMDSSSICYIHGQRETDPQLRIEKSKSTFGKNNTELIVGFAEKYVNNILKSKNKGVLMNLLKRTEENIVYHRDFFDRLKRENIKEIYSFGLSFSDADMPYIKTICDIMQTNNRDIDMIWYIAPYGCFFKRFREKVHFINCIKNSGFRGKIRVLGVNLCIRCYLFV